MMNLLFELTLKATLLLTLACTGRLFLKNASAASRYLLWMLAVAGLLLLPALSRIAPRPRWTAVPAPTTALIAEPTAPIRDLPPAAPPAQPFPWSRTVELIYLCGVTLVAARLAVGCLRVRRLIRTARYTNPPDVPPDVQVLLNDDVRLPIAWGWRHPVILLPTASQQWPTERLRLVIAHEMAHIRRWDFPGQIAAHLACAIYWFHPLAWWVFKQLVKEREQACDDEVLNMGIRGTDYAEHLLSIVRSAGIRKPRLSPAIGMADHSSLEKRLVAMLNPAIKRSAPGKRMALLSALTMVAIVAPLASIHAWGQGTTGAILGVVRDPSKAVIPRARVTATNVEGRNIEATVCGADGSFQFNGIPPGRYTLEVRSPGFAPFSQKDVVVTAGAVAHFEAGLGLGGINETIDVVGKRPASAALPVPRGIPQRIKVGGNVQASKLLRKVNPVYPEIALAKAIEGTVILRAVIGKEGQLLSLTAASSSDPDLVKAALDAVSQWAYEPTLLNGEPVEVLTTISVTFRLT